MLAHSMQVIFYFVLPTSNGGSKHLQLTWVARRRNPPKPSPPPSLQPCQPFSDKSDSSKPPATPPVTPHCILHGGGYLPRTFYRPAESHQARIVFGRSCSTRDQPSPSLTLSCPPRHCSYMPSTLDHAAVILFRTSLIPGTVAAPTSDARHEMRNIKCGTGDASRTRDA